jgi:choline/glycine/proline betaine transport protein
MTEDTNTDEMSDGLQVELFHPESDREPGDTNIQRFGFDVHPIVFPVALAVVVIAIVATLLLGDTASSVYDSLFTYINNTFGPFYILAVNFFIGTLLVFAFSKYGEIRIGGVEAEKEFSDLSWMAMLFSAGMGIGLMFFSVAEPMWHFGSGASDFMIVPPVFSAEGGTTAAATASMAQTFFHWGFHPWAIYGLVGLGLAFFSFNRGLPLTFRSVFWPLLGERIYGWPGHAIDIITVFATLFGLSSSLGFGVAQINTGLSYVGGDILGVVNIPTGATPQVLLIAGITLIATASVAAGLDKGVKRLSRVNIYLMLTLLGFVLVVGPTVFIVGIFGDGLSAYLGNFLELSLFTGTASGATALGGYTVSGWMGSWTVFYWGWWISWAPFVGMFIARVSKGRTVREFVLGVLVLPSLFSFVWLATFGGSALWVELLGGGGIASAVTNQGQTVAMFALLNQFPLGAISGLLATLLVITFFVTSSDSGSLVVDHLTSGGKHDVPKNQRIFWAVAEGAIAATLLIGGGLSALQTAAITTGLPFAVVMCLMCYTIYLGLSNEYEILMSERFADRVEQAASRDDTDVTNAEDPVTSRITRTDIDSED